MNTKHYLYYMTKLLDLGLVGVYFLVIGTLCSLLITKLMGDPIHARIQKHETIGYVILKVIARTFLIMISAFLIRQIVKKIPFPLDGVGGFEHSRVHELNGGVMISFAIIEFQPQYKYYIMHLLSFFK